MRRMMMAALVAGGMLVLLPSPARAGGFCQAGDLTEGSGTTIRMTKSCYSPTILRTDVGATVTFVNDDPEPHTVTSAAGAWSDAHKEIKTDETLTFRFDQSGVYAYTCLVHPGMTGVIVVGDGTGPSKGATEIEVDPVEAAAEAADAVDEAAEPAEDGAGIPAPALSGALAGLVAGGAGFELGRRRRL